MSDVPAQNSSYVDTYQPPTATPTASPAPAQPGMPVKAATSETIEDQNIFDLLGVTQATDQEKEAFLDELQQVIWEDFLENDVELLLTSEELTQLRQLMGKTDQDQLAQQEAIVVFLEKLIPDLEEIMLEKALELKSDMVKERIAGMREYYANQPEKLTALSEAESLMQADKWQSVATSLNALG